MQIRQIVVILAIFACGQLSAAMYKWVDEDGNVHYTQNMPPQGAKVLQKSQLPQSRPSAEQPKEEVASSQEQPSQPAAPAESQQASGTTELTPEQEEQYRQTCERLKKNLDLLMEPKRIYVTTKEGTRHYLSDQEREERILRINNQLPRYCRK